MDPTQIVNDVALPVIESQIRIFLARGNNATFSKHFDEFLAEATIRAFRVVDKFSKGNSGFTGHFKSSIRINTWGAIVDFLDREYKRRPKTCTLYDCHEDPYTYADDDERQTMADLVYAAKDGKDAAILALRLKGMSHRAIAKALGIGRSTVTGRLLKIKQRYDGQQKEQNHAGIVVRPAP